jgi:hypothetical protein
LERKITLIDEIYNKYKNYDEWNMVEVCHKILPEWRHPGMGAISIYVNDILKALNKTEREIEIIADEVSNLEFVEEVLSDE